MDTQAVLMSALDDAHHELYNTRSCNVVPGRAPGTQFTLLAERGGDDQVVVTSLGSMTDKVQKTQAETFRVNCHGASKMGVICAGFFHAG